MSFRIFVTLIILLNLISCSKNKKVEYDDLKKLDDPIKIYKEGLEAFNINDFFYASEKFNEAELIAEFKDYIDSTYGGHYSKDNFQATEFIIDGGHGTGFCIGNVLKYAQRYGKKGSDEDARKDLMKVLHYALIQLYVHDSES